MYRPPSGEMRKSSQSSPPRLAHPSLTIRTSLQPTQPPAAPQSSTSSVPDPSYPTYPIPIPPDKQEKALKLYKAYQAAKREEELDHLQQSATSSHHGYHLSVPGTPAPPSATSRTSSKRQRGGSVSTSAYGGVTDMSSVMSFDGNESQSSAKAKAELSTYDGKKVKHRTRQKFSKANKAKTALIRHLGSCGVCHKRRVTCDLDKHHDIQSLERILQARTSRPHTHPQQEPRPSMSTNSQSSARSVSEGHAAMGVAQTNALIGLGQNEALQASTSYDMVLDIQSPAVGDPLSDMSATAPLYYEQPDLSALYANPYAMYQDGNMFPIGIQRNGLFQCTHLGGLCFQSFPSVEELLLHFEQIHFSFTRITPAHRFTCSQCQCINELLNAPCYNCRGQIEIWIYGNFIRNVSYDRHSPDGQHSQRDLTPSVSYYSAYNSLEAGLQEDPSMDGDNFNGGDEYTFQPDNDNYGGGPSQSYNYDYFNNSTPSSSQFQGNGFQRAWRIAETKAYNLPSNTSRHRGLILIILLLSTALTLSFSYAWALSSYTSVIARVQTFIPDSDPASLSILGVVGIVASFAMCSSVKHFTVRRLRSAQCQSPKCPLHVISRPMQILSCRVTAPDPYVVGGVYS